MFQNLNIFSASGALSAYAGRKQAVVASNIAHADTPGYKAQRVPDFHETLRMQSAALRATRPRHLGQGWGSAAIRSHDLRAEAAPNGNTVSLEQEMVLSVEAQRAHSRALAIYKHGLGVLRMSLGRR